MEKQSTRIERLRQRVADTHLPVIYANLVAADELVLMAHHSY